MRFATVLTAHDVNFLQDVPPRVDDSKLEAELRRIPGQRSGISTSYFFMLSGTEDLIKPDRWIGRFLARHLGYVPGSAEAQSLISGACQILRTKFAGNPIENRFKILSLFRNERRSSGCDRKVLHAVLCPRADDI